MRRFSASLLPALLLGCQTPAPSAETQARAQTQAQAQAQTNSTKDAPEAKLDEREPTPDSPEARPAEPGIPEEYIARDLPPIPTLELAEHAVAEAGTFAPPEGSDELAPRTAVAIRGGLLLAGQAYLGRQPAHLSRSWRWLGFAPPGGEPSSTMAEPGAIRAAIQSDEGGALLTGTHGLGFDMRGWFGIVDAEGKLDLEVTLEGPNTTEMFDLVAPGPKQDGELAVLAGYVDAQGWLVSLDAGGMPRWQRYIGSYGYTQIRGLARLDAGLLAIGSRAKEFGEPWIALSPGAGEDELDATNVEQRSLNIAGADKNQMLRAIVDGGEDGLFALGTAKLNHMQDHDQVLLVALDRDGAVRWSKTAPELRVVDVHGGRARPGGGAIFVVSIPTTEAGNPRALALVEVDGQGASTGRQLADSINWGSAGFVEGEDAPTIVTFMSTKAGLEWRRSILPG